MKVCSTSLVIRTMQIKTTMEYNFMLIRMVIKKKHQKMSIGEDVE